MTPATFAGSFRATAVCPDTLLQAMLPVGCSIVVGPPAPAPADDRMRDGG